MQNRGCRAVTKPAGRRALSLKIEMFGKEREFTLKGFLFFIGKVLLLYSLMKLYACYIEQVNAEEVAKMQAAIPAVVSMDGTQSLPEKIEMVSRTRGFYYGRCHINEKASEKDIVKHYKSEFQKYGWKYIGRYYWKDIHPERNIDERYYCFEKEGEYCMNFCLQMDKFVEGGGTRIIFAIDLKKDNDDRKYCKIEDEES